MPEQTIDAFADHGHVVPDTIEQDMEEAYRTLQELSGIGIEFGRVTWQLEHEGVQKFIEPYEAMMESLEEKRRHVLAKK
jgi:transaldolase